MKPKLLFLILFIIFFSPAFAADEVTVTSLSSIVVNGKAPTDIITASVLAPTPDVREAIRTAVLAYETALKAAQETAQQEIAKAAKLRASCEAALAAGDLDTLKSLLQPAVDEAKQSERERKIAELTKQRDELQKQIDEASRAEIEPVEVAPAR